MKEYSFSGSVLMVEREIVMIGTSRSFQIGTPRRISTVPVMDFSSGM